MHIKASTRRNVVLRGVKVVGDSVIGIDDRSSEPWRYLSTGLPKALYL